MRFGYVLATYITKDDAPQPPLLPQTGAPGTIRRRNRERVLSQQDTAHRHRKAGVRASALPDGFQMVHQTVPDGAQTPPSGRCPRNQTAAGRQPRRPPQTAPQTAPRRQPPKTAVRNADEN